MTVAISGRSFKTEATRSSAVLPIEADMLMIASQLLRMRGMNCSQMAGSLVGRPSFGSRACRWMMAAPAFAASIDWVAISSGVTGKWGDIDGDRVEPVAAQVSITA